MIERGEILRARPGEADVRMLGSEACESCGSCTLADGHMVMEGVIDRLGAPEGGLVEVEVPEGSRLRGSLLGYGVPVLALVVGYLAGRLLGSGVGWEPDTAGAVLAMVAVAATFAALRFIGADLLDSDRFRPRVRAIIPRNDADHVD